MKIQQNKHFDIDRVILNIDKKIFINVKLLQMEAVYKLSIT